MKNRYLSLLVVLLFTAQVVFGAGSFLDTISNAEKAGVVSEQKVSDLDARTADARARLNRAKAQSGYYTETANLMTSVHFAVAKSVGWTDVTVLVPPDPAKLVKSSLLVLAEYIRVYFGISLTSTDATQKVVVGKELLNWTQAQALAFYQVLYKLPKLFTSATKKLARIPMYQKLANVLGYVYSSYPTVAHICNSAVKTVAQFQQTIVHEMTHCSS